MNFLNPIPNSMIILLLIIIVFYTYFYVKNRRYNRLLALIPGPPAKYPFLGNFDLFLSEKSDSFVNAIHYAVVKLAEKYKEHGIFKLKVGPFQKIFIFRNDFFEDILKDNNNIQKSSDYLLLKDWLGNGLTFNNDSVSWKQRRKLLTPAFHLKSLESFIPIINEKADILVLNLSTKSFDDCFDLFTYIDRCTIDIISETMMGYKMNSQQNQNLDYLEAVHSMTEIVVERIFKPWLWPDWIFHRTSIGKQWLSKMSVLHGLSRKVIDKRIEYFMKNRESFETQIKNTEKLVLLDLLLDKHLNEKSLSYENVCEEVDTFMFTGHDTTAVTLSWAFYLIGLYPDVQGRLFKEIDSLVSNDNEITKDQINKMVYMDAVLNESMRIYPLLTFIIRKISYEIKLGLYTIPKESTVYLYMGLLNMDPIIFPEPTVFNPDRFIGDKSVKNRNAFSFVPFSAGPRNCIGQRLALIEMKIIITKVLLNYRLKSMEKREEIKILFAGHTRARDGIKIKISPRY